MSASSIGLWIVALVLLLVGIRAFRAVDPPHWSHRKTLLLLGPLTILPSIYAGGGWINRAAWWVLSISALLLISAYRDSLARDAEDQARNIFDALDPQTKEQIRHRTRTVPFHRRRLEKLFGMDEEEERR